MRLIPKSNFNSPPELAHTNLYTLSNSKGMTAQITNYGATLVSLWVLDNAGQYRDVVLGYDSLDSYLEMTNPYFGRTIGRYGNRIANARFMLQGREYLLETNDGRHNLHSGSSAFHSSIWEVKELTAHSITLFYYSPAQQGGFPGNLKVTLRYALTDENMLDIKYRATTDATTHANLTHHSYFNLASCGEQTIDDHVLTLKAASYIPVTNECIPLGTFQRVAGTPFDFTKPTKIGSNIQSPHPQIQLARGYDHTYILNGSGYRNVACAYSQDSGISMNVFTDEPGLQFYTGNNIVAQPRGKYNTAYKQRSGFCLESQHYPDSPNRSDFPSTLLKKGDVYSSRCSYRFDVD